MSKYHFQKFKKRIIIISLIGVLLLAGFGFLAKADFSIKPSIISASVEPEKVKPGDIMTISAEIKDNFGIKSVTADMGGIETIELKKIEGNIYQGIWEDKWKVHSTEAKEYTATIIVTNLFNKTATKEIKWSDPIVELMTGYTQSTWGTGTTNPGDPYNTEYHDSRAQSLYLASDLTAAGMPAGTITAVQLYCYQVPGRPNLKSFRIRMQLTSDTTSAAWKTTGWTVVYGPTDVTTTAGVWQTYTLTTSFVWDGTSNLLIDFSRDDTAYVANGGMYRRTGLSANRTYSGYNDSGYTWPFDSMSGTAETFVPSIKLTYTPANAAPTASTISETSTAALPTNVGSSVTFSGAIDDPDASDQVRLAICKTDVIAADGTCTGGEWCYDPGPSSWQDEGAASCDHTVQSYDAISNPWYAYACDDSNACTAMTESDGFFYVNPPIGFYCYVSTGSCAADTTVFKMSGTSNAHAELPSGTAYNSLSYVCCSGVTGLSNSCSGNYDTVLRLSGATNAHVEKKTESNSNYNANKACLSVSSGTVTCDYASDCSTLGATYVCLASISGSGVTNAHVGDCYAYSTKVCCKINNPPTITSVADEPDPQAGGQNITFTTNDAQDTNVEDTIKLYICNNADCSDCVAGGIITECRVIGAGAAATGSPQTLTAVYTVPSCLVDTKNYYAKVCDAANTCSSITSVQTFSYKEENICEETVPGNCFSTYAIDGFCCNSACDTTCYLCNIAGSAGTCTQVAAGTEGRNCTVACKECNAIAACVNINNAEDAVGSNNCSGICKYCSAGSCFNPVTCAEDPYGTTCSGASVCNQLGTCVDKALPTAGVCAVGICAPCSAGGSCAMCASPGYCCSDAKCKGNCCVDTPDCSADVCCNGATCPGTCPGCLWRDYYCGSTDKNCAYTDKDSDNDQAYCDGCKTVGFWNLGGETAQTNCCGDDASEYKRTCAKSGITEDICAVANDNEACCNASNKCVYKGACYADGDSNPDYLCIYCNAGTWAYRASEVTGTFCGTCKKCNGSSGACQNVNNADGYNCTAACQYCLSGSCFNPVTCAEDPYGTTCSGASVCNQLGTCVVKSSAGSSCLVGTCTACTAGSSCAMCASPGHCCADDAKCKGDCCVDGDCTDTCAGTCPGSCVWRDYYCSVTNKTCAYNEYDPDLAQAYCTGCDKTWDGAHGHDCCGDDSADNWCNTGNGSCVNGVWYANHCSDGVKNCDEVSADCGGSCSASCVSVSGWAWAELAGRGWISFNSTNCDVNGNGTYEGATEGAPAGCPSSGTVYSYGVNIYPSTYELSGQAWSENLGWISFNRSETYTPPAAPYNGAETYIAKLDTTDNYKLKGWARVLTACASVPCASDTGGPNAGGWDGWLKLTGDVQGGGTYGVTLNTTTKEFEGWAWGGNSADSSTKGVIGWVAFNDKSDGTTGPYDYQVTTTLTFGPTGPTVSNAHETWDYCTDSLHPGLYWNYVDGNPNGYRVEIYSDAALTTLVYAYETTGTISTSHSSYYDAGTCHETGNGFKNSPTCNLSYATQYWWKVKAQDSEGSPSNWATDSDGFTTKNNPYPAKSATTIPAPDDGGYHFFTWSPWNMRTNENVQFTDKSQCFASPCTYSWTFENGDFECVTPGTGCTAVQNPIVKWTKRGDGVKTTRLTVTDSYGYSCYEERYPTLMHYPKWREIIPW